jgi:hypothetical protein
MRAKMGEETKQPTDVRKFAEEELRLRDKTLSRTAPDVDEARKGFDPVTAPIRGGMVSTADIKTARIEPPTGANIDREAIEHRDKALRNTPSDTDPRKKRVEQITSPERGGMR